MQTVLGDFPERFPPKDILNNLFSWQAAFAKPLETTHNDWVQKYFWENVLRRNVSSGEMSFGKMSFGKLSDILDK